MVVSATSEKSFLIILIESLKDGKIYNACVDWPDVRLVVKPHRNRVRPKYLQIISIIASSMPNSEELIIPGESHNLGMEKPQVFNGGVLEFLSIYR